MALILNIDTAAEVASVCLSDDERVLSAAENRQQQDHAGWLQPAIKRIIEEAGYSAADLHAVAVTAGPGSYTGLRVGLSTAKGLCFALQIPLITVNTLEAMARAVDAGETGFRCPMIDARRLEVFTAIYDESMQEVLKPVAMHVEADSFDAWLHQGNVLFFGSGAPKLETRIKHVNARFVQVPFSASCLPAMTSRSFHLKIFSDLISTEPAYFKEFYTPAFGKRQ